MKDIIKKLSEKWRYLPAFVSILIVGLCGFVIYGVGRGVDAIFGEVYPLHVYPTLSDLSYGDITSAAIVLIFVIATISYNLARYINETKQTR